MTDTLTYEALVQLVTSGFFDLMTTGHSDDLEQKTELRVITGEHLKEYLSKNLTVGQVDQICKYNITNVINAAFDRACGFSEGYNRLQVDKTGEWSKDAWWFKYTPDETYMGFRINIKFDSEDVYEREFERVSYHLRTKYFYPIMWFIVSITFLIICATIPFFDYQPLYIALSSVFTCIACGATIVALDHIFTKYVPTAMNEKITRQM